MIADCVLNSADLGGVVDYLVSQVSCVEKFCGRVGQTERVIGGRLVRAAPSIARCDWHCATLFHSKRVHSGQCVIVPYLCSQPSCSCSTADDCVVPGESNHELGRVCPFLAPLNPTDQVAIP